MKQKDILDTIELLTATAEAGMVANDFLKVIIGKNLQKNKDFVMLFRTIRPWLESNNPEIKLTIPEKAVILTMLPYVNWSNQIELLQEDMQKLCGYKDRWHFGQILNSLVKKKVLEKTQVGRQNYWFFNTLLVKRGSNPGKPKYIKFELKD